MLQDAKIRNEVRTLIEGELTILEQDSLKPQVVQVRQEVEDLFDSSLTAKVHEGVNNAKEEADQICAKWSSKVKL